MFFKGYSCRYYYNRNIKATQHQDPTYCSTTEIDESVHPLGDHWKEDSGVQTEISLPPKWLVEMMFMYFI